MGSRIERKTVIRLRIGGGKGGQLEADLSYGDSGDSVEIEQDGEAVFLSTREAVSDVIDFLTECLMLMEDAEIEPGGDDGS